MDLMATLLYCLSGLLLLAFLHPYVTYPLGLRLARERPLRLDASAPVLSASLMFAAYNEERSLPAKLANLEAIKRLHPDLEILAYSDMSSDATEAMLRARPDLLTLLPAAARTGKATGMRLMVERATGDICIFTDANVMLEPESVARLLAYFSDPAVGGVCGTLHYVNEDGEGAVARVGGLYWRLEERIKALESRCGSVMGADGSIFAMRRSIYPLVPAHLLDDMTASLNVVFAGHRLISAADVIATERNATRARDEFRRKRRIGCRAWLTHRHLVPLMRQHFTPAQRFAYRSHKLLRWFGAPILLCVALALTAALLLDGHGGIALDLWAIGAFALLLGAAGLRPFADLFAILLSILAAFLGVIDGLRGRTYQTWAPAASRA